MLRRFTTTVIVISLIVGVALRFVNLGHAKLDFDETFTAMVGRLPVGRLLDYLRLHDSHPPLDYLFRKPLVDHTTSAWLIRLPSAVASVVALAAMARWLRGHGRLAAAAVPMMALSSFALTYERDARMYAGMAMCGLLCAWAAWQWLNTQSARTTVAMACALLPAMFLHSSALFLAGGLFLVPGLARSRNAWVWRSAVVAPVAAWGALWGTAFRYQAGHSTATWIPYTRPDYLLRVLNEMVDSYAALRVIVVLLIATGGILLSRRDRALTRVFLTCFVVPVGLVAAIGVDEHLLLPRTLAFASWAPMIALAAVVDFALSRSVPIGAGVAVLLAVVILPSGLDAVRPSQPAPAAALARTAAVARVGDAVAIHPDWLAPLLRWHLGVARPGREVPARRSDLAAYVLQLGTGPPTGRIWLVEPTTYHAATPGLRSCAPTWERDGYRVRCLASVA